MLGWLVELLGTLLFLYMSTELPAYWADYRNLFYVCTVHHNYSVASLSCLFLQPNSLVRVSYQSASQAEHAMLISAETCCIHTKETYFCSEIFFLLSYEYLPTVGPTKAKSIGTKTCTHAACPSHAMFCLTLLYQCSSAVVHPCFATLARTLLMDY